MGRVLYITDSVVPYRTRFFNLLAQDCDLLVLYGTKIARYRDSKWGHSIPLKFKHHFLNHKYIKTLLAWLEILLWVSKKWDVRIMGCVNKKLEIWAMLYMRMFHIPYYLNLDGETFFDGNTFKAKAKRFIVKGARKYFVAGDKAAENLRKAIGNVDVEVYNFSSLSEKELSVHRSIPNQSIGKKGNGYALVVGAYFTYKGLDVALETAKLLPDIHFKFIGANMRAGMLEARRKMLDVNNAEIIPFLQLEELYKCYQECSFFILPSLQECWGLVINEAASFGTPIISTWGSGAAVDFLAERYPQFLAIPDNPESLKQVITDYISSSDVDKANYSRFLIDKSKNYSIEESVRRHLKAFEKNI